MTRYALKATLLGPVKVIPQEYPNITCRSIDVVLPKAGTRQEYKLIDYLWAELAQNSTDMVVAYRGHHRWVQTFEPVRLGDSIEASSRLREGGVYLIVGGLEGIGLVLAEHLAQTSKAKLALIKDADFSTRDRWESWLSLGVAGGDVNRQNRKLQELEMLGAKVLVVGADVTDRRQMQTAIAQAEERFGQLNGVIYAAGGFGRRLFHAIEETDKTESERQFQPAIHGLLVLEEALREKEIDFCLLISSLSSILGGLGLVTYVAANNFMDAFARQNGRTNPIPWISANWDSWKFEQEHEKSTASGAELDELAITPTQGGETFRRILSCGEVDQLIVSTGDLQARIDRWVNLESRREDEQSEDEKAILLHARPNLPNPYVAPHTEVERTIVDVWQELMGIEQIGIYDDFFELGGHSLLATQIISRMRETFEIDLPLDNLFEQPNVAFLAEYIETVRWAAQGLQAAPIAQEEGRKEIEF